MAKKKNIFDVILDIILILISILVIYWLIRLIIGGSPDLSEVNLGLIFSISLILMKIYREMGEIKTSMRYSFIKIKDDINLIKQDIELIKNDLSSIKKKLK